MVSGRQSTADKCDDKTHHGQGVVPDRVLTNRLEKPFGRKHVITPLPIQELMHNRIGRANNQTAATATGRAMAGRRMHADLLAKDAQRLPMFAHRPRERLAGETVLKHARRDDGGWQRVLDKDQQRLVEPHRQRHLIK